MVAFNVLCRAVSDRSSGKCGVEHLPAWKGGGNGVAPEGVSQTLLLSSSAWLGTSYCNSHAPGRTSLQHHHFRQFLAPSEISPSALVWALPSSPVRPFLSCSCPISAALCSSSLLGELACFCSKLIALCRKIPSPPNYCSHTVNGNLVTKIPEPIALPKSSLAPWKEKGSAACPDSFSSQAS